MSNSGSGFRLSREQAKVLRLKLPTVKVELELDSRGAELLATLDDEGNLKAVLLKLADHAQQGVYRRGAWEREWLIQAFGTEFIQKLIPGDPYGRNGCESVFQKPKGGAS